MTAKKLSLFILIWAILLMCGLTAHSHGSPGYSDRGFHSHDTLLCASADEQKEDQGEGSVIFRILVVPGKTAALIDSIRVIDRGGKTIALLDVGSDGDSKGENHVVISDENQWGPPKREGTITARGINEGNGRSMHSSFALKLDKAGGLRIVIRYKDMGEDLMPLEIFDGQDFRRISQILLENSGQWLEEDFSIPDRGAKTPRG